MTDAGEKLAVRVKRMIGEGMFTADMIRAELERDAEIAEAERGQPEYEHDDIAARYGKRIAAAIRRRKL